MMNNVINAQIKDKDFIMEMNGMHIPSYAPLGSRRFKRLMDTGVFVAFADCLLFNDKAYLFVGGPNSGKTSVVRMFNNYNKDSRVLSEDSTTLSVNNGLFVYDTIKSPQADLNPILSNDISYTLDMIISLDNNYTTYTNKHTMNATILRMFNGRSIADIGLVKKYFDNIRIISVPRQESLRDRYALIKKTIIYRL